MTFLENINNSPVLVIIIANRRLLDLILFFTTLPLLTELDVSDLSTHGLQLLAMDVLLFVTSMVLLFYLYLANLILSFEISVPERHMRLLL